MNRRIFPAAIGIALALATPSFANFNFGVGFNLGFGAGAPGGYGPGYGYGYAPGYGSGYGPGLPGCGFAAPVAPVPVVAGGGGGIVPPNFGFAAPGFAYQPGFAGFGTGYGNGCNGGGGGQPTPAGTSFNSGFTASQSAEIVQLLKDIKTEVTAIKDKLNQPPVFGPGISPNPGFGSQPAPANNEKLKDKSRDKKIKDEEAFNARKAELDRTLAEIKKEQAALDAHPLLTEWRQIARTTDKKVSDGTTDKIATKKARKTAVASGK